MEQYLPILLLFGLALVFAIGSFAASKMLAPGGRMNPAKAGPYESGIAPRRELAPRFPVRFYLVAMIFIIFDIEVVFLYPFAVMFNQLSAFGFIEMASFAVVVFIAFAYLVSEGALDWGPGKRLGSRSGAPSPRTVAGTIRRVSRPGMPPEHRPAALAQQPRPEHKVPAAVGASSAEAPVKGSGPGEEAS